MRSSTRIVALLAVGSSVLLGCGSDSKTASTTSTTAPNPKDTNTKPVIAKPSGAAPTTLQTSDIVVGTGPAVAKGSFASLDYVGVSWSDGTEFDSSWKSGTPFSVTIGQGQVIPGWDQGIIGMKVGGRRRLVIPPKLAYGTAGQGSIKPNETLIFVVDLRYAGTAPTVDLNTIAPTDKLVTKDLIPGTGRELAEGDSGQMHYVGYSMTSKKEFVSSWSNPGEGPFQFMLKNDAVIPGLVKGLPGMKVGGRRLLVIPPDLAYGAQGAGNGAIAPNDTLVWVVDLVGINK